MVILKNGKQLETIAVYGGKEMYQGSQRETLTITLSSDTITLDEAKSIWQDTETTSEITITYKDDETEKTSVHLNFTLPMTLSMDTLNGDQVIYIKLAQKSQLELTQEQHTADISALDSAILEIGELLGGDNNG